jgi:hypothetical protein
MGVGDFKDSVTGNIEPAYVVVHDYRAAVAEGAASGEEPLDVFASLIKESPPSLDMSGGASGPKKKIFRVQYNPSELEVTSNAAVESQSDLLKGDAFMNISGSHRSGNMGLSVKLWFDKMSAGSSFMMEKNVAPTSASGLTNIIRTAAREESVQKEVEGFIAALRSPYTRIITFHWADFIFTGSLTGVSAEYVMFSTSGLPVRARVTLNVKQEAGGADMQGWIKDFDTAFENDSSSLVPVAQRASNLLNMG